MSHYPKQIDFNQAEWISPTVNDVRVVHLVHVYRGVKLYCRRRERLFIEKYRPFEEEYSLDKKKYYPTLTDVLRELKRLGK